MTLLGMDLKKSQFHYKENVTTSERVHTLFWYFIQNSDIYYLKAANKHINTYFDKNASFSECKPLWIHKVVLQWL